MWRDDPASVRPMLASPGDAPLDSAAFAYEPKYDGIRAIVAAAPPSTRRRAGETGQAGVRVWSRLGNEKTRQFPEVADAVQRWARNLDRPVILDGEIVALDQRGEPTGFQNLQRRMHAKAPRPDAPSSAFIAFDLLRDGDEDLRPRPLRERRRRLEALFDGARDAALRLSEQSAGDGRALDARARALGWEGLIAKRLDSIYRSGRRSPDWRKLKLERRQACVIGGWTDPRGSRPCFGALLLGVNDERGHLRYVGHSGAGFTDAELGRVWARLRAIEAGASPFVNTPRANERPHWVAPRLVAEVKFTEWTADGRLRHPTYLGLRDDLKAEDVRKEPDTLARGGARARPRAADSAESGRVRPDTPRLSQRSHPPHSPRPPYSPQALLDQLDAIQDGSGDGVLLLPGGGRLEVSNLAKVFWPKLKLTKGDLFRHYVRVAACMLPVLADRPLVMKRYPNGVDAKPFYQHRAPGTLPAGVRVDNAASTTETRPHLVGGSLVTLLYSAQLASISQDPWFSRIGSEDTPDHAAIDLDPPERLPFSRVLDVARWVREELEALGAPGFAKTSGAGGLHIYVPLPPDTPYRAGLLFCQIVGTIVARKHPTIATVERSIEARGRRIYIDYLQNSRGKTLASAYSARANDFAGVSTPVTWDEIDAGVSPKDFTIRSFAARLASAGDLWAPLRQSTGADLRAVMKYAEP